MNHHRSRIARLRENLTRLRDVETHLEQTLADYTTWAEVGYGSGADSGPVAGGDTGSSTERAALAPNPHARYLDELLDAMDAIDHAEHVLTTATQIATRIRAEVAGDLGCNNCARVRVTRVDDRGRRLRQPLYAPVYDTARRTCRFCTEFRDRWGKLPVPSLVRLHHEGRKASPRTVREHMPELGDERAAS